MTKSRVSAHERNRLNIALDASARLRRNRWRRQLRARARAERNARSYGRDAASEMTALLPYEADPDLAARLATWAAHHAFIARPDLRSVRLTDQD